MELASNGDLLSYITKKGLPKEGLACMWFTQVSEAVNYLPTEALLCHRDIKLDNILLDQTYNAKLSDFGFCYKAIHPNEDMSNTYCGSKEYACPEIIENIPYSPFKA